jgi:hypothetical protein
MSVETIETTTNEEKEVMALSLPPQNQQTSTLQISHKYGNLPENRPIEVSHLNVLSTFSSNRPVTASDMEISGTLTVSGKRPIALSHLNVSQSYTVMGNRPVASNQIDDSSLLMGYLD